MSTTLKDTPQDSRPESSRQASPQSTPRSPRSASADAGSGDRGERFAERLPELPIYKPNARGSGGVLRFGLNPDKRAVFVDAAPQSGERQFDWESKLTMKWGLSDLGAVLAVLQRRQPTAKLFHQSEHANSAFEISRQDDPERAPYWMSLSRQQEEDRSLRKVGIPLTHAEAALLETALRRAVERLLGWA